MDYTLHRAAAGKMTNTTPANGEKNTSCHSHWLLPVIIMGKKPTKQASEEQTKWHLCTWWCIFSFLHAYFYSCLLNCEGNEAKPKGRKTNIYCLWLHQAVFMCSQSVTLIVDIHLSLIAWLQLGGHLYKTAEWDKRKITCLSFIINPLELTDFSVLKISSCVTIWLNCRCLMFIPHKLL